MNSNAAPAIEDRRDNTALARKSTARPLPITPKVRAAIECMVNDGADYQTAAHNAGLSTYALRTALSKPHVAAFLKAQTHVLLSARRPRNIHRLAEIADAENNMPAVNAIKTMDAMQFGEHVDRSGSAPTPGVTIRIVNVMSAEQTKQIEHDDTSQQ